MAELILIRHGKTAGNLLGRYIGSRTDEPLCDEGREGLARKQLPEVERLYVSPMRRCVETAELLWPEFDQKKIQTVTDLRECDFGEFENKNYKELSGNVDYQAWIDSNGTLPFPGGESNEAFRKRCCQAFQRITEGLQKQEEKTGQTLRAAVVVHGGTIMAILERFGTPKKNYFDYQVKNGCGYRLTPVEGTDQWNYQYLQ